MLKSLVENFTRAYYLGVTSVDFFDMEKKRNIKISFYTEDDFKKALVLSKDIRPLLLADPKTRSFIVNRDYYESIMYVTAAKGAMDKWIENIVEEAEEEDRGYE